MTVDNSPTEREKLTEYFRGDGFDYKRGYIREIMKTCPEITDAFLIDAASEAMYESHTESVELSVADALRLAANEKPVSVEELVKMLEDAGVDDDNFEDTILSGLDSLKDSPGTVKNPAAKQKAQIMTALAETLDKNPDVLILGLPTFDPLGSWTQVKLALFSENLSPAEQQTIKSLMHFADSSKFREDNGTAILSFKIFPIWAD